MKNKWTTILFLIAFICTSCLQETPQNNTYTKADSSKISALQDTITVDKKYDTVFVDKTYVGMTLTKLKSIYKDLEFKEEPMFFYGVDSEENGWLLNKNRKPFIFVWTQENSDTIKGITILTDEIVVDKDVRIGMTVNDFFNKYKNAQLQIDAISNDTEFGFVMNNLNYRVEFLTKDSNRVGEYDLTQPEPEFIKIKRPNAKIDRIGVFN